MKFVAGFTLLGGALALPLEPSSPASPIISRSPKEGERSDRCGVNDVEIYTQDNWKSKEITEWFENWYMDNIKGAKKVDDTFSSYWGLGQTMDCSIQNECERPKCSELKRPDQSQDYEHASMILTSMANFNKYCVRLYEALNGANIDFATMQVALQQTFYPGKVPSNFKGIQGLNGATAAIGIAAAATGPLGAAVVTAGANSLKEIFSSVARGVSAKMTASDVSLKTLADMGTDAKKKHFGPALAKLETMHNDVLEMGVTGYTTIDQVFMDGAWVDKNNIPVLSSETLAKDIRKYFNDMIFAMTVSKAWVQQGAYIFSRKMDEKACKEFNNYGLKKIPHLCYKGRSYWLNKYVGQNAGHSTGVKPPPGTDKLEEMLGFTVEDAMKSSIDSFNEFGYQFTPEKMADTLFDGDIEEMYKSGARFKGTFNIPVCEVESSDQFDKLKLDNQGSAWWRSIEKNYPDSGDNHGLQICLCSTAKDRSGTSIKELKDDGGDSFRALIDKKPHRKCDLSDFNP